MPVISGTESGGRQGRHVAEAPAKLALYVGQSARWKGHNHRDGPRWICLCSSDPRDGGKRSGTCCQMQESSAGKFHPSPQRRASRTSRAPLGVSIAPEKDGDWLRMQCLPTALGLPFKQDAVFGMSARCSSLGQNTPLRVLKEGQTDDQRDSRIVNCVIHLQPVQGGRPC
jgi:hypothetical protein